MPSATWIITDLYASGLPQFAPDDWEQVGATLTLKRSYHVGQRIDYRYRIAQTSTLSTSTLADGTALLPSLGFTNDPDTGLYRPAANVLGVSAGGAERARFTTAGMQVTGLLSGTAVTQSATDTTAGRLFKVGDFGLGAASPIGTDFDALLASGFYSVNNGAANQPTSGFNWTCLVIQQVNANNVVQIAVSLSTNSPIFFIRRRAAGTWSAWQRFNASIGAVGNVGGIPTGALIERGSNANGQFVRFADGTQICTHTVTASLAIDVAHLGGFRSAAETWTFPAAFSAAPSVVPVARNLTAGGAISANVPGTTSSQYALTAVATQTNASRQVSLTAIGQWF